MSKYRRRLSYDWIAEELAQAFQLPLLSVPVQLGAQAFSRLAHHQQQKRTRPRHLPPHLWHAARQEACSFCIQTLARLMKVTESPESLSDEQVQLYEEFLKTVREYLETPPPQLSEPMPTLSPSEQMRYEQQLWRHAREALELCERWRKALSQHKVPENGACGASGGNLRARRKAQP
ncbi:MAG: hypothetical protein N2045_09220 [Fimbriimonadales bacterium]|nr:hypothetical protein [Armatimonadota bacterium]MCX7688136.1 hypothetical protein [Fimbriimonadales bacterium]CUU36804.1 hypothetical protein DCOP10_1198 [Armatimonadetes bacterium DC]